MRSKSLTTFPEDINNRVLLCERAFDAATSFPQRGSLVRSATLDAAPEAPAIERAADWNSCAAACVRNSPLFAGLPLGAHRELSSKATKQSFSTRQAIFREDDPIRYLHIIGSGSVKITQLTESGNEVILRVDRAWTPIDEMGSSDENTHTTSAFAIGDCCILTWYTDEFADFAKRFPVIHSNATRIMQLRLRRLQKSFCDLSTARVPQRLARVLLQLLGHDGNHDDSIGFSRQELAEMAGTSPFMISRLLSQWAERGIVFVSRSQVTIDDRAALLRLAEGRSG